MEVKDIKIGERYYHGIFGWCKVTHPPTKEATLIDCEADIIEYYVQGKGNVKYEKDQMGQIVCVPADEIFKSKEDVPAIYGLRKLAMNLKLTPEQ